MNGNSVVGELIEAHATLPVADQGEGPGGGGPPLFLDQNEARRAEKNFFETAPLSQGLDDCSPPPLSESLDPPLASYTAMLFIASYCGT